MSAEKDSMLFFVNSFLQSAFDYFETTCAAL